MASRVVFTRADGSGRKCKTPRCEACFNEAVRYHLKRQAERIHCFQPYLPPPKHKRYDEEDEWEAWNV